MKRMSLNELMGKKGDKAHMGLSEDDVRELLGPDAPTFDRNPLGRVRLIRALKMRFGSNYRNLPGISKFIKQFDQDIDHEIHVMKLKQIKPRGGK